MAGLELRNIRKSFGSTDVLKGLSLEIADGEFLSLVGESGCGKSTLLRIISGLEAPDSGEVLIAGEVVNTASPKDRNISMVFQDYALYPHMSVAQNIAMPLIMARLPLHARLPLVNLVSPRARSIKPVIASEVEAVARQLRIEHLLNRRPAELSGGQRQRVALGRALVRHPKLFLMDEPLSNLDAKLRVEVRKEITELHQSTGYTFVYVTHDQTEAMTMSHRVALLQKGELLQLATPSTLYADPNSVSVARFIGSPEINILPVSVGAEDLRVGTVVHPGLAFNLSSCVQIGLRPEAARLVGSQDVSTDFKLAYNRHLSEDLGHEVLLHGTLAGVQDTPFRLRVSQAIGQRAVLDTQEELFVGFDCSDLLYFDAQGERLRDARFSMAMREAAQ
ncbi:ABC transporter ATP-binding protein [Roseibium sp. CAU 1637]|uniref:ABC transporter ATP-binding protein n=1 Tax=Roseibium limicola TaxID=2816037 RepID=A0A939ES25_9HYPH|nr:ABC transporter ATP-binding protein [Roseibium limicola]